MSDRPLNPFIDDVLYRARVGVAMGRFAPDIKQISEYQRHVWLEITRNPPATLSPEVRALGVTIERHAFVRMYVEMMLQEVPANLRYFTSVEQMLQAIEHVVGTAPIYRDVQSISWQFPLSALMNFWMMTPSGRVVLRMDLVNRHLNAIMKKWCTFLDSAASLYVVTDTPHGWLSPPARKYNDLDSYIIPDKGAPHWGFQSYNEFFHRDIKPECRPVEAPDDPAIVCSPNDGVAWAVEEFARETDSFWLKSQAYSLRDMLNDNPLTERFVGGTVYQSYVNGGADWHRFTAPISGIVRHVERVEGYAWTESDTVPYDPMSGPYSQGWAAGVATRGLLFIDSGHERLGIVCVVPIGLTEVSSLEFYKIENGIQRPLKAGDPVKKGEQVGWFSFGGSSFALVFQPGALLDILVKPPERGRNDQPDRTLWANKGFAIANV